MKIAHMPRVMKKSVKQRNRIIAMIAGPMKIMFDLSGRFAPLRQGVLIRSYINNRARFDRWSSLITKTQTLVAILADPIVWTCTGRSTQSLEFRLIRND